MQAPTPAQDVAKVSMLATTSAISVALVDYEKWLVAGTGAAVGLAFGSGAGALKTLSHAQLIGTVALVSIALVLACIVLLLGAQVAASVQASEGVEKAVKDVLERHAGAVDLASLLQNMRSEVERGLWWPASWGFRYGFDAAMRGDYLAGIRLTAKLSQTQQYLFVLQLFALLAAGVVAALAVFG